MGNPYVLEIRKCSPQNISQCTMKRNMWVGNDGMGVPSSDLCHEQGITAAAHSYKQQNSHAHVVNSPATRICQDG